MALPHCAVRLDLLFSSAKTSSVRLGPAGQFLAALSARGKGDGQRKPRADAAPRLPRFRTEQVLSSNPPTGSPREPTAIAVAAVPPYEQQEPVCRTSNYTGSVRVQITEYRLHAYEYVLRILDNSPKPRIAS